MRCAAALVAARHAAAIANMLHATVALNAAGKREFVPAPDAFYPTLADDEAKSLTRTLRESGLALAWVVKEHVEAQAQALHPSLDLTTTLPPSPGSSSMSSWCPE